jgi:hypothetical protein
MASTYSALKIELIGTGEQSGTWGATTNLNLGDAALGEAITGSADVNFATAADVTVTLTDTNTTQTARHLRLNITESSTGVGYVGNLILGAGCQIEKLYLINNATTAVKTIKNTTGTGIAVPAGKSMFVFNNGTNVVDAVTALTSLVIAGTLGVTGAATFAADSQFTSTGAVKLPVGTTAQQPAGAVGKIRYNSTLAIYEGYNIGIAGTPILYLTHVTTTASVTTYANHGLASGTVIVVSGCTPAAYNGTFTITVTGLTTFNYTMLTDPITDAVTIGTYVYNGWSVIGGASAGGGATGGGGDQVFVQNQNTITTSYTIPVGYNAESVGPITFNPGAIITVPAGQRWVIL